MPKFRKKPVVIDAVQMPTTEDQPAVRKVAEWMIDHGYRITDDPDLAYVDEMFVYGEWVLPEYGANFLDIETMEGTMRADLGDWIIRGVQGEMYPCKPDIFAATYEPEAEFSTLRGEDPAEDLRVDIVRGNGPATCRVHRHGVLVFDGVDRSVLVQDRRQDPTEKVDLLDEDHSGARDTGF